MYWWFLKSKEWWAGFLCVLAIGAAVILIAQSCQKDGPCHHSDVTGGTYCTYQTPDER